MSTPKALITKIMYGEYCKRCKSYEYSYVKLDGIPTCAACLVKAVKSGEYTVTKGTVTDVEAVPTPALAPLDQGVPIEVDWGEE